MKKKIIIISDSNEGGIYDYAKLVYKKLSRFENAEFYFLKKSGKFRYYKNLLGKLVSIDKYTIVDLQCLIWPVAVLTILIKKIKGFKLIFEAHDEPFSKKLKYRPFFIRKFIMKSSDLIVAHSRFCESQCKKIEELPTIDYIPFGPLLEYAKIMNRKTAKKRLSLEDSAVGLFFGTIQPNKGLDILLKALPGILKEKKFQLIIVGPAKENFSKYEKIIENSGIENHVKKVIKYVPAKNASIYFSASDFVVLPYKEITQSAVPFVAYIYKRPLIASNVGGFKEIVRNYKTGILFKSENIKDLEKKVIYCIKNEMKCKIMGSNGFALITKGEYGWKNIINKYLETFRMMS